MLLLGPADEGEAWFDAYAAYDRSLDNWPAKEEAQLARLVPFEGGVEYLIPDGRTDRVLIKIAKGLQYRHTGQRVPERISANAQLYPVDQGLGLIEHAQFHSALGDTFAYAGLAADDGSAVWWMAFYQRVEAIVTFLTARSRMRD